MGYSGYSNPTPPRSVRVILGAAMVNVCLFFGTTMFTHEYHRTLTMGEKPDAMTWNELTDRGLKDNSYVRLTNVRIEGMRTEDDILEELMADIDPDTSAEDIENMVAEMKAEEEMLAMFGEAFQPVVVVPDDANPFGEDAPQRVLIPLHSGYPALALEQYEVDGSITGYVSSFDGDEFAETVMTLLGYDDDKIEELKEQMGERETTYTFYPMSEPPDESGVASRFWFVGLGLSFGLILCCSGGPSMICCFFFWWPSALSLLGYPMRYGRGGWGVRLIYFGIGAAITGLGFKLMVLDGHFGQCNGDPLLHALGFICTFVGLAGVMCVPMQIAVRKFVDSTEVKPRRPTKRLSYEQACSLKPIVPDGVETEYLDRKLIVNDEVELPNQLVEMTNSLEPLGFAKPITGHWQAKDALTPFAIQLGCESMVLCDIESIDGVLTTRLVSVLHDGLAIITISKNSTVKRASRMGTNGCYWATESNDPLQMMAGHLQETATMSENRDSTIVKMDVEETKDVCLFGRRALADIQSQYGEEEFEVSQKCYGRFHVPAQRVVGELASV